MNYDVSVYGHNDYVLFLENILQDIRSREISYSQADFANDLGLSTPRVSQLLKRKEGISVKRAKEVVSNLDMSELEETYFLHLISAQTSKSLGQREISQRYIRDNYKASTVNYLPMSKWSLLEFEGWDIIWNLLEVNADFTDRDMICKISNLSKVEINNILEKMLELNLIEINNQNVIKRKKHIAFGNAVPSEAVRKHHKLKCIAALRAIDTQGTDTRVSESMTFTMRKEDFIRLKNKIETFVDNFLNELDDDSMHDEISTLNVSLFSAVNNIKQ
jgi:uncharacterized protein (TIGR02147 family)